ncbi:MAG: DUF2071 domain-containing protein [Bacteroidota bacterium]|nr:DUF2071 domain-containing protein [Bacteroidota bacterium]
MASTFLKAEWRKLILANYSVDKSLLLPHVPYKTELDSFNEICYVSLVGFMFLNTCVKGIKIPFHSNFEEVNLRFYVRYKDNGEWKRGAVFIKEIVPKAAITFVANTIYGEHYQTLAMKHTWEQTKDNLTIEYNWKNKNWNSIKVIATNKLVPIEIGSEAEFITEHYWGYTQLKNNKTSEYGVEHPRWKIYPIEKYFFDVDFKTNYGSEYNFLKNETPKSVFLAEGSEIQVKSGRII